MSERFRGRVLSADTGLPVLPPFGQFWRVKKDSVWGDVIELRKKALIGSRLLGTVLLPYGPRDEHSILVGACRVLDLLDERKAREADAKFYGDYPPKRLSS